MKKTALAMQLGGASIALLPTAAYAHGGDVPRDYVHVVAAIFGAPVVCMCGVLALISACLLRSEFISRWRAAYCILAIVLSMAGSGLSLLFLLQGGPIGFGYAAVVIIAGSWSIRLAARVVGRNRRRSLMDGTAT